MDTRIPGPDGPADTEADPPEDLSEALGAAISHAERREEIDDEVAEQVGTGGMSPEVRAGGLAVLSALLVWIWTAPPAIVRGPEPEPLSVEMEDAGLRMDMFVQAVRIMDFVDENGSLPAAAALAGDTVPGVVYQVLGEDLFHLTGRGERLTIQWRSDQPGDSLIGDAPERIRNGGTDASN